MFNFKGLYEWKLIDKDTQEVEQQGEQWNVISDAFHKWMFTNSLNTNDTRSFAQPAFVCPMAILLSSSTITDPSIDYRIAGRSHQEFNILAVGSWVGKGGGSVNWSLKSKYCDHYFSPPASPRTINIIGIKLAYYYGTGTSQEVNDAVYYKHFPSFIQLSTPITQDSTQYLYVKYTVFCSYESSSLCCGVFPNIYHDFYMKQVIFTAYLNCMGGSITSTNPGVALTPFLPPVTISNVMRAVSPIYNFNKGNVVHPNSNDGSSLSTMYSASFNTSAYAGPIGVITNQLYGGAASEGYDYFLNHIYSYTPTQTVTPSISRIFLHPGNRDQILFRDAEPYPALSQGTVSVTGTPTNKFTMIGRIRITKTGDASDLVDEVVPYTAVNTSNSQITITQDFTIGDIYRISSSGSLPSPLVVDTNYYIIKIDSTHIQLAASSSDAISGNEIVLTTQGTGDHTLSRQNTGKYKLELQPYPPTTYLPDSGSGTAYPSWMMILHQLPMAIDYDGYIMPAVLTSTSGSVNSLADGEYASGTTLFYGVDANYPCTNTMLRGTVQNGEYIYSVQQSRKGLINNICRWRFNTVETSQPLCKFGNGSTVVNSTLGTADYIYIVTNDGIYRYEFENPTTPPVLLTITGMINNIIQDACIDPVTGYMWTGHTTGLSRINLGTLTATQYIGGAGGFLNGISAPSLNILPGALDAYNGRVVKGIATFNQSSWGGVACNNSCWVMDDGVGWISVAGTFYGSCIRKGTNEIVARAIKSMVLYEVIVTGTNAGTVTVIESLAARELRDNNSIAVNITQLSDKKFVYFYSGIIDYYYYTFSYATYIIGEGAGGYRDLFQMYFTDDNYFYYLARWGWIAGARRNLVDVDGNSSYAVICYNWLVYLSYPNTVSYGWDGSSWVKENPNSREIPLTPTHSLVNGLTVNFNNATGELWDRQFILNESYNVCFGPQTIKDNLQELSIQCKTYFCAAYSVMAYSASVGVSAPYVISIPEKSDPNFRDMDNTDYVTEVIDVGTSTVIPLSVLSYRSVTYDIANNIVTTGTGSIATGTPVILFSTAIGGTEGHPVGPLDKGKTYYAINYSATQIRLAKTYADAMAGTPYIDLYGGSTGTQYLKVVTPTAGTYFATLSGDFFFNSADAGKAVTLTYTYTKFST